jgi:hypothetical protein
MSLLFDFLAANVAPFRGFGSGGEPRGRSQARGGLEDLRGRGKQGGESNLLRPDLGVFLQRSQGDAY